MFILISIMPEKIDVFERLADVLKSHPKISEDFDTYHTVEVPAFRERVENSCNLGLIIQENDEKTANLLVEVADTPGLFMKAYKIFYELKIMEVQLLSDICEMLKMGLQNEVVRSIETFKKELYEDNNEDNGH